MTTYPNKIRGKFYKHYKFSTSLLAFILTLLGTTFVLGKARDYGIPFDGLAGPIMITNTHVVGTVHQATIEWAVQNNYPIPSLPVVAETWDGFLNDINGFHVKKGHVFEALNTAQSNSIAEGNVGSGTLMICYQFKGGIGRASRMVQIRDKTYTVGVWVQANHGLRDELLIRGKPIGKLFPIESNWKKDAGSIIIAIATDAPLLPFQLNKVARRTALGLGFPESIAHNSSGDIFIAFSTANPGAAKEHPIMQIESLANSALDPIYIGTVEASEEAIINALFAAVTMEGINSFQVPAIDKEAVGQLFEEKLSKK